MAGFDFERRVYNDKGEQGTERCRLQVKVAAGMRPGTQVILVMSNCSRDYLECWQVQAGNAPRAPSLPPSLPFSLPSSLPPSLNVTKSTSAVACRLERQRRLNSLAELVCLCRAKPCTDMAHCWQFVFECEGDDAPGCMPGDVCVILKLEPHSRFFCAGRCGVVLCVCSDLIAKVSASRNQIAQAWAI